MRVSVVRLFILLLAVALPAAAADWPGWRGPNHDGIVSGNGVFDKEAIGLELAWKADLGPGYSSIAVAGDHAITMYSDGESDLLVALDTDSGREAWRYSLGETYKGHDGSTDGPLAMPTVDGNRVFALGPHGQLAAVKLEDGKEIWRVDTTEVVGSKAPTYGFTTSPLVVGKVLFVQTGGDEGRSYAGFDKATGKVLWTSGEDTVGYQSPIPARLAGFDQILAVSNTKVVGLDPASGRPLWTHQYAEEGAGDGSATPVLIGEDSFLLGGRRDSARYRVEKAVEGFDVEEMWRSTALKGSWAVPVLHEGHLYGFDGNFLTCVNAENGEKVWKSRPPGGAGLIAVDNHLVVFSNDGDVVVARATPEGYDERARLHVGDGALTWPAFGDGRIFVRNLEQVASLTVGEAMPAVKRTAATPARNDFERFVREVEAATENKTALVDDFMVAQSSFPIVEGDRWLHIVYRGDVEDLAVTGSMTEFRVEEPMEHVAGTDLYYKSYELEPGSRVEYQINVDFDNLGPDPANPRHVPTTGGEASEVWMPGWKRPDFLEAYRGSRPGRLETFTHESAILENEREVTVYVPAGHPDGGPYRLVVVNRGEEWLDNAQLPNVLNNLVGDKVAPVIVAFVRSAPGRAGGAEFGGPKTDDYVTMLADELVPALEEKYNLIREPGSRAVMGATRLAMISAYIGLKRPDVFGKVGVHSMYIPAGLGDQILELVGSGAGKDVDFWVDWNRYELVRTDSDLDLRADSRKLWQALESGGYDVRGGEAVDGFGWGSWRIRAAEMLQGLFPKR